MAQYSPALALVAFLQASESPSPPIPADVKPELTPPRMKVGKQSAIDGCYPWLSRRLGEEGRTVVVVTVQPDGGVGELKLPPGIQPWQEQAARCIVGLMTFTPAMKDGVPIVAQASVPINFALQDSSGHARELSDPKVASTPEEVEEAFRACYPADTASIAWPQYSLKISARGKVTDVKLVESCGDAALDRAGMCMFEHIKFEPLRRGKEPVSSTVTMPLLLRPPK